MKKTVLLLLGTFCYLVGFSQKLYHYEGKVLSEDGSPVEQAHIYTVGTHNKGTVTNANGAFSLKCGTPNDTLYISHVAYLPAKHYLSNSSNIKIVLQPSAAMLEEVTVTALTAREVVERAIERLEVNHFVEPVYYEFYSRSVNFSKDSIVNLLEEFSGYIYQKKNHTTDFSLKKSRMSAFSDQGDQMFKERRLISMTELYTDNIGKYTEDFLDRKRSKNYEYTFKDDVKIMGRACFAIGFTTDRNTYYREGNLYIDKEDFGVLRNELIKGDFKQITFKKVNGKYYLSSTEYLKSRKDYLENRSTIYNIVEEPADAEFIDQGRLAPGHAKKITEEFHDEFWNEFNFIPLPDWITGQVNNPTN